MQTILIMMIMSRDNFVQAGSYVILQLREIKILFS